MCVSLFVCLLRMDSHLLSFPSSLVKTAGYWRLAGC